MSGGVYVKIRSDAITSGLMRELGAERWQTLCALAAYSDRDGFCYPSMEQLGRDMGISRQSVAKRVQSLCKLRINGEAIVVKTLSRAPGAKYDNCRYHINTNGLILTENVVDLTLSNSTYSSSFISLKDLKDIKDSVTSTTLHEHDSATKALAEYNSRDILHYFCAKYKETYGDDYVPAYQRECSLIKNKLLAAFGAERLTRIIDAVFAFYDHKWASVDYPRPTIGQLATWLANKAAPFVDEAPAATSDDANDDLDYETMKARGLL